jgi:hypothetical protein
MTRRSVLLSSAVAVALLVACTFRLPFQSRDEEVSTLSLATQAEPKVRRVISRVLNDIEQHHYACDDQLRSETFEAIIRLQPHNQMLCTSIRRIALMPLKTQNSYEQLLDYIAITRAMGLLTELSDPMAVEINLSRINDQTFGPLAAEDLRDLRAWHTTETVERAFLSFAGEKHSPCEEGGYLLFLSESPRSSSRVCSAVRQSLESVDDKGGWLCSRARPPALNLFNRFRCQTDMAPGNH